MLLYRLCTLRWRHRARGDGEVEVWIHGRVRGTILLRRVLFVEGPILDANQRSRGYESNGAQGRPWSSAQRCSKHRRCQMKSQSASRSLGGLNRSWSRGLQRKCEVQKPTHREIKQASQSITPRIELKSTRNCTLYTRCTSMKVYFVWLHEATARSSVLDLNLPPTSGLHLNAEQNAGRIPNYLRMADQSIKKECFVSSMELNLKMSLK